MHTASIISIGDEILRGRIVDTNFAWLSRKLFLMGIDVVHHSTIPDKEEWVCAAFGDAVHRTGIVFSTGGLGPTPDDATRKGLTRFLGREMVYNARIAQDIREFFQKRGLEMPENNLLQAYLPEGAVPMENSEGTAPGIFLRTESGKFIFLLPGPPGEMKAVFRQAEMILKNELQLIPPNIKIFKTIGVPESLLEEWISEKTIPDDVGVAYYPSLRGVDIFLSAREKTSLETAAVDIRGTIQDYVYFEDDEEITIESVVGDLLRERGKKVAVAESCTGGMLASRIVDISGSSDYFLGGVVSYSNSAKVKILGVWDKDIEKYGAVSPQVARQMAFGVREKFNADCSIGITGIAGPTGGTKEKPVGLVYIAFSDKDDTLVRRYNFVGGREAVRTRSATAALNILWVNLKFGDLKKYPFQDGGEWV
ncbi:competence/damage-inducible protein A [bacterium]|nr:competence/damage-inducible protein A [bacterium]